MLNSKIELNSTPYECLKKLLYVKRLKDAVFLYFSTMQELLAIFLLLGAFFDSIRSQGDTSSYEKHVNLIVTFWSFTNSDSIKRW